MNSMDLEKRLPMEDKLVLDVPVVRVSCCAVTEGTPDGSAVCPSLPRCSSSQHCVPRGQCYAGQAAGHVGTALAQGGQDRRPVVPPIPSILLCHGTPGSCTHCSRGAVSHSSWCLVTSNPKRFFWRPNLTGLFLPDASCHSDQLRPPHALFKAESNDPICMHIVSGI